MTIEQLRNVHQAQPFVPFTIHLGDGRSFLVPHRDSLSHSPSGRTIIVFGEGEVENFGILDLLLVTEINVNGSSFDAPRRSYARVESARRGSGRRDVVHLRSRIPMASDLSQHILSQVQKLSREEQRELAAEIKRRLSTPAPPTKRRSLLELRGLGKEIWSGVDVREYLRKERDSWDV